MLLEKVRTYRLTFHIPPVNLLIKYTMKSNLISNKISAEFCKHTYTTVKEFGSNKKKFRKRSIAMYICNKNFICKLKAIAYMKIDTVRSKIIYFIHYLIYVFFHRYVLAWHVSRFSKFWEFCLLILPGDKGCAYILLFLSYIFFR